MSNTAIVEVPAGEVSPKVIFPTITDQTCFSCGSGAVRATHVALRGDTDMYFCRSHAHSAKEKLVSIGFVINPEDTSPYDVK